MKHLAIILSVFQLFSLSVFAQTKGVVKTISTNAVTEDLVFGSGRTLTVEAGGTIVLTGATVTGLSALQAANNLSDLASAATARTNLGLGAAALVATSAGSLGAADSGKVPLYNASGSLFASSTAYVVNPSFVSRRALLGYGTLIFQDLNGSGFGHTFTFTNPTASRATTFQDATGTVALLADILTAVPSQTGNGGKYLTTDGSVTSWATVATGITINTSAITGGTSGRFLYNNAGTVGERTAAQVLSDIGAQASGSYAGLTSNTFNGLQAINLGNNSATPAAGLSLTNSTAATVGVQSASPSLILTGQGWKTAATAASQQVDLKIYLLPVQASSAPTYDLRFDYSTNGGAYANSGFHFTSIGGSSRLYCAAHQADSGSQYFDSFMVVRGGGMDVQSGNVSLASTGYLLWNNDTFIRRSQAAGIKLGTDTNGTAVSQTITAAAGITGTDIAGASLNISSGLGTGSATPPNINFQTGTALASGTTAQTYTTRMSISASGLAIGASGSAIAASLNTTTTWDPGNLADGASETKATITLTGAVVGDVIHAALTTITASTWTVQATVTAADTVAVTITNHTGGDVDLASGTLRILGFR